MELLGAIAQAVVKIALAIGSIVASVVPGATATPAPVAFPPGPSVAAVPTASSSKAIPGQLLVHYRDGVQPDVANTIGKAHGASKNAEIGALRVRVVSEPSGLEEAVLRQLATDP